MAPSPCAGSLEAARGAVENREIQVAFGCEVHSLRDLGGQGDLRAVEIRRWNRFEAPRALPRIEDIGHGSRTRVVQIHRREAWHLIFLFAEGVLTEAFNPTPDWIPAQI